jgi:CheY-like chemotaxis protein
VLLAEPHLPTREFLEGVLNELGLTPEAVAQPEGISARLQDGARPQAAIFDSAWLGDAASDLVAAARAAGIPSIVLGSQQDAAQFGGALRYLAKPLSQQELLRALGTVLATADPSAPSVPSPLRATPERTLRVLLVDDTPANQKLVRSILERRGHQVQVAANGRKAIELVESDDFDVILMDVQMPEMDGFQATQLIRGMPNPKSQLPILALTAHAMLGDDQRCLTAGMDAYIPKPIDRDRVVSLVEHFGRPGGRRQNLQTSHAATS